MLGNVESQTGALELRVRVPESMARPLEACPQSDGHSSGKHAHSLILCVRTQDNQLGGFV